MLSSVKNENPDPQEIAKIVHKVLELEQQYVHYPRPQLVNEVVTIIKEEIRNEDK